MSIETQLESLGEVPDLSLKDILSPILGETQQEDLDPKIALSQIIPGFIHSTGSINYAQALGEVNALYSSLQSTNPDGKVVDFPQGASLGIPAVLLTAPWKDILAGQLLIMGQLLANWEKYPQSAEANSAAYRELWEPGSPEVINKQKAKSMLNEFLAIGSGSTQSFEEKDQNSERVDVVRLACLYDAIRNFDDQMGQPFPELYTIDGLQRYMSILLRGNDLAEETAGSPVSSQGI